MPITVSGAAAHLVAFLEETIARANSTGVRAGGAVLRLDFGDVSAEAIAASLENRGILDPEVLAERFLRGIDIDQEARALGIGAAQTLMIYEGSVEALTPDQKERLQQAAAEPHPTGAYDRNDPEYLRMAKERGLDHIPVLTPAHLEKLNQMALSTAFVPKGQQAAVDLTNDLGRPRDQGGRGTCTAFAATAVVEGMEYLRDRRAGARDLSEEYAFWFEKNGQLNTGGGSCAEAILKNYEESGGCEEQYFPYSGRFVEANQAHVPAPEAAMDRAQFYRQGWLYCLNDGDVNGLKTLLRSGVAAAIHSDVNGWNTATGVIEFPADPSSQGRGGGHSTAVVGYIDRDGLPAIFEGGYFIVRNSWGYSANSVNKLGPDYDGYLLMPYGWYRRYSCCTTTLADPDNDIGLGLEWQAEFYDNRWLRGLPKVTQLNYPIGTVWGAGSPVPGQIPSDNFSARFTQIRRFRPGWYRFRLTGDDGVRLWVDDQLVVNGWKVQSPTQYTAEAFLAGGDHVLRIEYFEATGGATLAFAVDPVVFQFDLFDSPDLTGGVKFTFTDTMTDLEWRHAPPVGKTGVFSLRASGTKNFRGGVYRFHARHTGGCRIWVDSTLVLDDWSGTAPDGQPVTIAAGDRALKIEFRQLTAIPAAGVNGYYRSALAFDWSDDAWIASFYSDLDRQALDQEGWDPPDRHYEGFCTRALTGSPVFECVYANTHNVSGEYTSSDSPLKLYFENTAQLGQGIAGSAAIPAKWQGLHIRRRVKVAQPGWYTLHVRSKDGYRLVVDGKAWITDKLQFGDSEFACDCYLDAGVHDFALEHANNDSDVVLCFDMQPAVWSASFYSDFNLQTLKATKTFNRIDQLVSDPLSKNYSVRITRSMLLPVGRYRILIRAADGVRLRMAGKTLIEAWHDESDVTNYDAIYEHRGGDATVEFEHYCHGTEGTLAFLLMPEGFFAEYYSGVLLEKPDPALKKVHNPPVLYRCEPEINFDWGSAGPTPRIGPTAFSARWWGGVDLPVGRWIVRLEADDGVRLYLDGRLVIESWQVQVSTLERTIDLVGREHDIRLEYFQQSGGAKCRLEFERSFSDYIVNQPN